MENPPPLDSLHFLEAEPNPSKTAVVSYSRSGNTLIRTLLENTTQLVTGSDDGTDDILHFSLQIHGFQGCGIVDERAQFVKTHYPLCNENFEFEASKIVCVVRNPLDVCNSMFNFWATHTQCLTIKDEEYHIKLKEEWDAMVA